MSAYRSPYEAYPFLCDEDDDLRCDFELLTDELASGAGLLRSRITEQTLTDELLWVCELIYHMNPTLRTSFTVTGEETTRLAVAVERLEAALCCHVAVRAPARRIFCGSGPNVWYACYIDTGSGEEKFPTDFWISPICSPAISFCLR